jgi:hypothetical protein
MKPIDYFNESLDDRLSVEEAAPKKKLGKVKSFALAAAVAATFACGSEPKITDGLKLIYNHDGVAIYSNPNASVIKIDKVDSILRTEEFFFRGPPLRSLFDLDDRDLRLVKYANKKAPLFNTQAYDDPQNIVDKAYLRIKDSEGKKILRIHADAITEYMKK